MPDDFCFNVRIVHACPSLGLSHAHGVAEVLPVAAGADKSMPDGSTELYEVQVEAETAVQPDETGGVADRLPHELVGANHVFGAPMQKVFSPLPSSRRHTSTSTCLARSSAPFSPSRRRSTSSTSPTPTPRGLLPLQARDSPRRPRAHRGGASLSAGCPPLLAGGLPRVLFPPLRCFPPRCLGAVPPPVFRRCFLYDPVATP